jgi:hypothetical protein
MLTASLILTFPPARSEFLTPPASFPQSESPSRKPAVIVGPLWSGVADGRRWVTEVSEIRAPLCVGRERVLRICRRH